MATYQEKLKDPKWREKRLKILERDGHKCRWCESEEELQVHHTLYLTGRQPWEYPNRVLITLCDTCHHEMEHRINEIKWVLSFIQQDSPWMIDNARVALKRLLEGPNLADLWEEMEKDRMSKFLPSI